MRRFTRILTGTLTGLLLVGPLSAATLGGYSDVAPDHENGRVIGYMKDVGIMTGYPNGTFGPDKTLNRAELMKILVEAKVGTPSSVSYSNCFADVRSEWFAPYVCYAFEHGWVRGYPDGLFRPGNTVNVVETLKMLVNSRGYGMPTNTSSYFQGHMYLDIDPNSWFAPYVQVADERYISSFFGLALDAPLARRTIAEFIYRALLSEGDVTFQIGTAASCQLRSLNTLMLDSTNVTEGGILVDVQQTLRGEGKRECLIAQDFNPYSQIAHNYVPTRLYPMGNYNTQSLGTVTERMSVPAVQETAFFVSGYSSGDLTNDVWEYNLNTGLMRMVESGVNGQAMIVTPDETFALYPDTEAHNLFVLNLRSGEKAKIALDGEVTDFALSPNGAITYELAMADGATINGSTTLSSLFSF